MFKIKDKVKVLKNTYNHNYTIGKVYEISMVVRDNSTLTLRNGDVYGNSIPFSDVELYLTKKIIIDKIDKINKDMLILKKKIDFLDDNNFEKFDDLTFKTFNIINLMENKKNSKPFLIKEIKDILLS